MPALACCFPRQPPPPPSFLRPTTSHEQRRKNNNEGLGMRLLPYYPSLLIPLPDPPLPTSHHIRPVSQKKQQLNNLSLLLVLSLSYFSLCSAVITKLPKRGPATITSSTVSPYCAKELLEHLQIPITSPIRPTLGDSERVYRIQATWSCREGMLQRLFACGRTS